MERIIEDLEKDLLRIMEGKPLKTLRKELGDEVDIRALRMVVYALQWASVGYQSALRFAGMKLGKKIGTVCEKTELSLALESIKKIIESLRNGKVKIEIMPKLKEAHLKISESSLTSGVPNVFQKLCFFDEGFIEGYLEGVISKKGPLALAGQKYSISKIVNVEEKKCIGLGDDFCDFIIKF